MKKTVLWLLLELVFLIVFNVIFFLTAGSDHPASVWISYAFIHFAYLMVAATPILTRESTSAAIFGVTIQLISSVYFAVEFAVGLIFIFLRMQSVKPVLVVQIPIAGAYAVLLLSTMIANESTADSQARREAEISYLKTAASRVKALMGRSGDTKAERAVERAYDLLHSSPVKSTQASYPLEVTLIEQISRLEQAVREGDSSRIVSAAETVIATMEERNRRVMNSK